MLVLTILLLTCVICSRVICYKKKKKKREEKEKRSERREWRRRTISFLLLIVSACSCFLCVCKMSVPDFLKIGDNLVCGRGKYGGNIELQPAHH